MMQPSAADVQAFPLAGFDLRHSGRFWAFARENRARIDEHWRKLIGGNPHLWNGEALVCLAAGLENGVLRAELTTTDYASFVAWRDWGTPDTAARNCFGCPVVLSADGAIVFGEMGPNTLNAGLVYPPSGSLEPRDITADGRVDLMGSIATELSEETGLAIDNARPGALLAIFDGHRIAVCQALAFPWPVQEIEDRFRAHRQPTEELTRLVAIREAGAVSDRMPPFAQEIVRRYAMWFEGH